MGRFARIWMLAAVCVVMTAAWAASAGQVAEPSEVRGPTYPLRQLRQIEIEGVRLGMSEGTASDILAARGYTPVANSLPGQLNFYSADQQTRIAFDYANERGPRIIESIILQRSVDGREMMDVEARRAEILEMLGRPTEWTRAVDASGYPHDTFRYTSNRSLAANFLDVWSCQWNWRCADVDCRTYLSRMQNGGVIDVDFGMSGYWIQAFDLSHYARTMRRDRAFMARDLSDATCPVPYVH
jgi:hypothetical protein